MNRNKFFYAAAITTILLLVIDFFVHGKEDGVQFLLVTTVFNLIYISGWMYSIRKLFIERTNGNTLFTKNLFELQVSLFFIANACNILVILEANHFSVFSRMCEFFWLTSNIFMTVTAIVAINVKSISWKKHSLLLTSIWIPLSLIVFKLLRNSMIYSLVIVLYPTLACLLVGYMASTSPESSKDHNKCQDRKKYRLQKKYMLAIN